MLLGIILTRNMNLIFYWKWLEAIEFGLNSEKKKKKKKIKTLFLKKLV